MEIIPGIVPLVIGPAGAITGVAQAEMAEFYGQKVFYSPLVIAAGECPYLLMEDPLGVSEDNDPAQDLDGTTALIPISGNGPRLSLMFYVPHDKIRAIGRHAKVSVNAEIGTGGTWTTVSITLYSVDVTTGVATALSAVQTITLNLAGAASRKVGFILQDVNWAAVPLNSVVALKVGLSASATAATYIRAYHSRGKPDVRLVSEVVCDYI